MKARSLATVVALALNGNVHAYMPAPGLWAIDSELNGLPGRGIQIEVENEVLVLSYYGYRADGSAVFYGAAGPISNNSFTASLEEFKGGKALGGSLQSGISAGSPGTVTMAFTSGQHGTITLPGENPVAISKYSFGYGNNPESLLGSWAFAYPLTASSIADHYTLTTLTGIRVTANGTGMVGNSTMSFACEAQIAGALAGQILCTESIGTYPDAYVFKMSGDRGAGIASFKTLTGYTGPYPLTVVRTATKTGRKTGINDGTDASLNAKAELITASAAQQIAEATVKESVAPEKQGADGTAEAAALQVWAETARSLMTKQQ